MWAFNFNISLSFHLVFQIGLLPCGKWVGEISPPHLASMALSQPLVPTEKYCCCHICLLSGQSGQASSVWSWNVGALPRITCPSSWPTNGSRPSPTLLGAKFSARIVSKLFFYWGEVYLALLTHSNGLFLSIESISNFWSIPAPNCKEMSWL